MMIRESKIEKFQWDFSSATRHVRTFEESWRGRPL